MIEKQSINKKDVWFKVDVYKPERENANIIPTEYFTVAYFFEQPDANATNGEFLKEENGNNFHLVQGFCHP